MTPASTRKRVARFGLLASLVVAFLMVALPASEGWPVQKSSDLTVTVVGAADGKPVAGATVTVKAPRAEEKSGTTNAQGRVTFVDMGGNIWQVSAVKAGIGVGNSTATMLRIQNFSLTVELGKK